jgi:predicted extracellular nuclease
MRKSILVVAAFMALANSATAQLRITGVIDGPLSGGLPKAIEIYVDAPVADLTLFGLGSANNGGGSDGEEFTFPAGSANAGDFIYVASEATGFTAFFGFPPDYISSAANINGDDAIELFGGGGSNVIDVFGEINVDGTGQPWEHLDGWTYRVDTTGPDGPLFTLGNWTFSGPNALDGETTNGTAATPFPIGTFTQAMGDQPPTVSRTNPADGADDVAETAQIEIVFSEPVNVFGPWFLISCDISGSHSGVASSIDSQTYNIVPDSPFVGGDSCQVTVLSFLVEDLDGSPDNMTEDFVFNFSVPLPPALVFIHEIQGGGDSSPLVGQSVIIEGVVTGDFQDGDADNQSNLRGFYIQEEDFEVDGDLLTSEGIFVFDGSAPLFDVVVGDVIRVTGTVTEFFGETQISNPEVEPVGFDPFAVTETHVFLPSFGVVLANGEFIPNLEPYEGMLVHFPEMLTVTELFNLDRFGELLLAQGGRFVQFTNNNAPDAGGLLAHQMEIASRSLMLDDGLSIQNPDPIRYPDPGLPNMVGASVRAGDSVVGLTGNIRYSRGSGGSGDETYRLMPTVEPTFVTTNPSPASAPNVGGSLQVASFNVLNYFTSLDGSGPICGPDMNQFCRGADNQDEFDRQHAKLMSALLTLDADVVGLIELENNAIAALQSIVDGLNAVAGAGAWDFIDTGTIGTDAIRQGLIYKTGTVAPSGGHAILDSSVDPLFNDTRNRPALAQSFEEIATGGVFTVAVNHLKSKGSNCDSLGDPDVGDGQGNCNLTRTVAAIALANWLAADPTLSGDPDYVIMGDLNAYLREDPVISIEGAGYTNLLTDFVGPGAYSFLFDGQIGALDHALSSPELAAQVSGVAEWHINADEADATDYNLDFGRNPAIFDGAVPNRASDHDPIVVGLNLLGDLDEDGVLNGDDFCPGTVIPETVPTRRLNPNRWALVDGDFDFDTVSKGQGPGRSYSTTDTAGCSCAQIIEAQGLGNGHTKFGCSISVMDNWVELVTP